MKRKGTKQDPQQKPQRSPLGVEQIQKLSALPARGVTHPSGQAKGTPVP